MRNNCLKLNNGAKGFSLIEAVVVLGIMTSVGLGFATMMSNILTSQVAVEEKLATIETMNGLVRTFADSAICGFQLNQGVPPVDLTAPTPTIAYPEIRLGMTNVSTLLAKVGNSLPGYTGNRMKVQSIKLTNIALISGNNFSGDLEVTLDPTTTRSPVKPFGVKNLIFTAMPPLTAATVASCGSAAALPKGNCPAVPGCGLPAGFPTQFVALPGYPMNCSGGSTLCNWMDVGKNMHVNAICQNGEWACP